VAAVSAAQFEAWASGLHDAPSLDAAAYAALAADHVGTGSALYGSVAQGLFRDIVNMRPDIGG
jgi:hypothetical protein